MKNKNGYDSKTRMLLIYLLIEHNEHFTLSDLAHVFGVDLRTVERDISNIKNALSEIKTFDYVLPQYELIYDRLKKKYLLLKTDVYVEVEEKEEF